MMLTKICTCCHKEKELNQFSKYKKNKDGHTYQCKECINKKIKERRKKKGLQTYEKRIVVDGKLLCFTCKQWKIIDDFIVQPNHPTGKSALCKQCNNEKYRKKYSGQPNKISYPREIIDGKLRCCICKEEKELKHFGICNRNKIPYDNSCKDCKRKKRKDKWTDTKNNDLKKKYKISFSDLLEMKKKQNYKCAICGCDEKEIIKGLAVDHDHNTGLVRGLLCGGCNIALGIVGDSKEHLLAMISYLDKYSNENKKESISIGDLNGQFI